MGITHYTIFGERCSGTNFLEKVITTNFDISITWEYGWKHFFCFNKFDKPTDHVLFIGIIRNPVHWLNSFSKDLHHIPDINKPLNHFLFNTFWSIKGETKELITEDLNFVNGRKYSNIFEMRKLKNWYLINYLPTKVEHYVLINYETLSKHYTLTLNYIRDQFGLTTKYPFYKIINTYKKTDNKFSGEKQITFDNPTLNAIWSHLYVPQENKLGYFCGDDNLFFDNQSNIKFIREKRVDKIET